jgi:hypothetical protein
LSDSKKLLASGIATVSKPNLMWHVGRVHEVVCVDSEFLEEKRVSLQFHDVFTTFFIYKYRSLSEYLSKKVE